MKVHLDKQTSEVLGERPRRRARVRRRLDAAVRHGRRLGRHPAERGAGARLRASWWSAGSSSTTSCAARRPERVRDRRVRAAPRAALRARRAAVGAGEGARRPARGSHPRRAVHRLARSTKLKVMGVDLAVMGDQDPADANDEVVKYSEPARGIYKKLIVRDGRLGGAILLGDASARAGAAAGVRPRHRAARQPRGAALPARGRRERDEHRRPAGRARRSATATACPRARSSPRWRRDTAR